VTATNANSQQVLRDEILGDGRRQGERIVHHARQDAEALVAKAKADAEKERRDILDAAKAEAQRRRELILATVPVHTGRMRSARVETVLAVVHDEAKRRLLAREGFDYRETVIRLAAEAISQMAGDRFVVAVSQADRQALGDSWLDEVRRRVGRPNLDVSIAADPAKVDGGVFVRDADGRQVWDDDLLARLERIWPAARREIATRTSLVPREQPLKEQ
jgi:V/A-type H+-transporting ATPase subunit E